MLENFIVFFYLINEYFINSTGLQFSNKIRDRLPLGFLSTDGRAIVNNVDNFTDCLKH